ncbi:MAG TPA: TorF family putative porin [Burkholderiales bacterium]|jgi:uncharacterized protein (TIGR02001 family)|nr:TorF family putative porin [Burkholderiales bacterium]
MRKLALAAAVAAVFASPVMVSTAQAQTAAPAAAPTPDYTLTGNLTIANDYRFRGVSQTLNGPTVQGGIDFTHTASGIYLGNWNSNVSGVQYVNGNGAEMDFYGGWRHSWGDWGLDVGGLYYYYDKAFFPGVGNTSNRYNNFEGYVSGSWKWLSFKYSYAFTDYFGLRGNTGLNSTSKDCFISGACGTNLGNNGNSKGTQYIEINASYEIVPKWTLSGHVGHVDVRNYGALNYTDFKAGIAYAFDSGWTLGAAVIGTNANKQWYSGERTVNGTPQAKDLATTTGVVSLSKTF